MKYFFFFTLSIFIWSCQETIKETESVSFDDKYSFAMSDSLYFALDSLTLNTSSCLTYLPNANGSDTLIYMDQTNNRILFYTVDEKKPVKIINLQKEGPEGVGKISGFKYKNADSIFVIFSNGYILSLIDGNGKKKKSISLQNVDKDIQTMPYCYTNRPIEFIDDNLYISGQPSRNYYTKEYAESEDLMVIYTPETGQFNYSVSFPEFYKGHIWGPNMCRPSHTFDSNTFIVSFQAFDSLVVVDLEGNSKNYYAGSKFITKDIAPYDKKSTDYTEYNQYFRMSDSYREVIYDPYRKMYYRVAETAISEADFNSGDEDKSFIKQFSIIVLDSAFNKVGEQQFPWASYRPHMFFVTEEGLYLCKNNGLEDFVTFGRFELVEK